MNKTSKAIAFFTLGITLLCCNSETKINNSLNYTINNKGVKEYYKIEYTGFTNQLNETFTLKSIEGKVTLANFFFTRCPSICPPMRQRLINLVDVINHDNFMVVSHTIDFEHDTVEALKRYSESTGISSNSWQFVRGSEKNTKKIANQYMTNFEANGNYPDFYHSSYATLLDKNQNIKGFYNLLVDQEIERLKSDIKTLLK